MSTAFERALQFVLLHECVFQSSKHHGQFEHVIPENPTGQRGGLKKWGLAQADYPALNIRALDYMGARELYRRDVWDACRCEELPASFAIALFDLASQHGPGPAVIMFQEALNAIGARPSLAVDGFLGPRVLSAPVRLSGAQRAAALECLLSLREYHLHELVLADATQQKFLQGWVDRNRDLAQLLALLG